MRSDSEFGVVKLILSRKGFDSSAGGCPSPWFPDGRGYALPIPDARSRIAYRDLDYDGIDVGKLVRDLTGDRRGGLRKAHLDPDLIASVYDREPGWRPCLGQAGSAQGHLQRQGVGPGDVFLFFGLFRAVKKVNRRWQFVPGSRPFHGLWGWMQVGSVHRVDDLAGSDWHWAAYHPHFQYEKDVQNTLYVASDRLDLGMGELARPASGTFRVLQDQHRLTAPGARNVTEWQLPACFYPQHEGDAMTYHQNLDRWSLENGVCRVRSAARGQEFVMDTTGKPDIRTWLQSLICAEESS